MVLQEQHEESIFKYFWRILCNFLEVVFLWKQFRQYLLHRAQFLTLRNICSVWQCVFHCQPFKTSSTGFPFMPNLKFWSTWSTWSTIKHSNVLLCELSIFQPGRAWSAGQGVHLAVFLRGARYFTELSFAFSRRREVGLHTGLGKTSCDAKTYCKFLFNSLNTAYRVEICFTLTPQFFL